MFTKLFSSITDSTIWREPDHIRIVWITMLAKSDPSGFVWASVPGLADAARVQIHQCVEAITRLKAADTWSRSQENEGRRIEEVDGGWHLLNYEKYRKIRNMDERREYVRSKVAEHRRNVNNVNKCKHSKKESKKQIAEEDIEKNKEYINVLSYLNFKSGKNFQPLESNIKLIRARFNEGSDISKLKAVIDLKCSQWLHNKEFNMYLRPATLFNAEKFAQYSGEIGAIKPKDELITNDGIFR